MIKKRLIGLLKDSKKYIVQNVLWQWLGLLAQIAAILAVGQFLDTAIFGSVTSREILTTGMVCVISIIIRMVSDKKASKASFLANSVIFSKSITPMSTHLAISAIPAFPGAQ